MCNSNNQALYGFRGKLSYKHDSQSDADSTWHQIRIETLEERLHRAARDDNYRLARAMIESGADIEARDSVGFTPLYRAIKSKSHKVAKVLLEDGKFVKMERTLKRN